VGAESGDGVAVVVTYQPITETGSCAATAPAPAQFVMQVPECAFSFADAQLLGWGIVGVWLAVYAIKRLTKSVEGVTA